MKKLFLVVLLVGAQALSFSYDQEVMILPEDERAISVYVTSDYERFLYVRCISELTVSCDRIVEVKPDHEARIDVVVNGDLRGRHSVELFVGGEKIEFDVIVSEQARFFMNELEDYEEVFIRLGEKYGESPLLEKGIALIESGKYLYGEKDFIPINGVLEDLRTTLSEYYATIGVSEEEEARLGLTLVPLLVAGSLVAFYYYRNIKRDEHPDAHEIGELVGKEFGGPKNG